MSKPPQYFRAGVGAVVIDPIGRLLAFERSDAPGAWQLPQGGLQPDEDPETALYRELLEETGLHGDTLEIVDRYPEPLVYELPRAARRKKTGLGQVQYWFLVRFDGDESRIHLGTDDEFGAWKWTTLQALADSVVEFRRPTYRRLLERFKPWVRD